MAALRRIVEAVVIAVLAQQLNAAIDRSRKEGTDDGE